MKRILNRKGKNSHRVLDERKLKRKGDQLHDKISRDRGMKENRDA